MMERASTWYMVLTALAHTISLGFDANLVSVRSISAGKYLKMRGKYCTVVFKTASPEETLFIAAKNSKTLIIKVVCLFSMFALLTVYVVLNTDLFLL